MVAQSSDPSILKEYTKNDLPIKAFDIAHEAGLSTTCNFIFGYPYETMDDAMKSVELAAKLRSDDLKRIHIYTLSRNRITENCS